MALLLASGYADAADEAAGRWVGEYVCAQGLTGVTLQVEPDRRPNEADAVFEFYPTTNPTAARGRIRATLRVDERTRGVELVTRAWIDRPAGYEMAGFRGSLSADGSRIEAQVLHPRCRSITLTRVGAAPPVRSPDVSGAPQPRREATGRRSSAEPGTATDRAQAADRPAPVRAAPPPVLAPVPAPGPPPVPAPASPPVPAPSMRMPDAAAPPPRSAQLSRNQAAPAPPPEPKAVPVAPWSAADVAAAHAGGAAGPAGRRRDLAPDEAYVLDVGGLRLSVPANDRGCAEQTFVLDVDSPYLLSRIDKMASFWGRATEIYAQRYWIGCYGRRPEMPVKVYLRGAEIGSGVFFVEPGQNAQRRMFFTAYAFRWSTAPEPTSIAPSRDVRTMLLDLYWSAELEGTKEIDLVDESISASAASRDADMALALHLRMARAGSLATFNCRPFGSDEAKGLRHAAETGSSAAAWQMAVRLGRPIGLESCGGEEIFAKEKIFGDPETASRFHVAACYIVRAASGRNVLGLMAFKRLSALNVPFAEAVAFVRSPQTRNASCERFAAQVAGRDAGLCAVNKPNVAPTGTDVEDKAEELLLARFCSRRTIEDNVRRGRAPASALLSSIRVVGKRCKVSVGGVVEIEIVWSPGDTTCETSGTGEARCATNIRTYCGPAGGDLVTGDEVRQRGDLSCMVMTAFDNYAVGRGQIRAAFDGASCTWNATDADLAR